MPVGIRGFDGRRLREAREARGISGVALADTVGVSRQAISQYEGGLTAPTAEVMERVATALNLPVAFFVTALRQGKTPTNVFFRSLSAATKTARLREQRRLAWQRNIVSFLSSHVVLPRIEFPEFTGDAFGLSDDDIDDLALQVRQQWKLGDAPIADIVEVLEAHGAVVIRTALAADSLDAYSSWSEGRPHIVLSDEKRSAVRSRYDCAHELGHLILHRSVSEAQLNSSALHKLVEHQAHLFAGSFLLPGSSFAADVALPTLDGFLSLKPKWLASVGVMIMRSRSLNLIDEDQERRLWIAYSSRGWRKHEPFDEELMIEVPRILRTAFDLAYRERLFSIGQLRMALPYAARDIEELCSLPSGHLAAAESGLVRLQAVAGTDEDDRSGRLVIFPGSRDQGLN